MSNINSSSAQLISQLISQLSPTTKTWVKSSLENTNPAIQDCAKNVLSTKFNLNHDDKRMDDIIFVLQRQPNSDPQTTKSFAQTKSIIGTKFNTAWQHKVAIVKPDSHDPILIGVKQDVNKLNIDKVQAENIEEYITNIAKLQKDINESNVEVQKAKTWIDKASITGFVKAIEEAEAMRISKWNKKKKEGLVKGANAGSLKNKKVTAIYSKIRNERVHWTEQIEIAENRNKDIIEMISELKAMTKATGESMDVSTTEISTDIPAVDLLDRLKKMKRLVQKMKTQMTSMCNRLNDLANGQIWKNKTKSRNSDFEGRWRKYQAELSQRSVVYHQKKQKKESAKTNKKRKRSPKEENDEENDDNDLDVICQPKKKKRKKSIQKNTLNQYFKN
eukprot:152731_1